MFENYIKLIYNNTIEKMDVSTKYISISEISDFEIEDYYLNFIKADIDYLIYKDKLERLANPNFSFQNNEFLEKIEELTPFYKNSAQYLKYELLDLIKAAVEIRLNILVRPLHALVWFVFKNELTKPLNEVLMKLNYLSDYPHIIEKVKNDLIEDNAENETNVLISSAEFKHRIVNIDLKFVADSDIDQLLDSLDTMFEFFNDKNDAGIPVIPAEALIVFIDDKGYKPLAGFLEKKYIQIVDAKISKDEIRMIFEKLEDSYNKFLDEDILNSSLNSFDEELAVIEDEIKEEVGLSDGELDVDDISVVENEDYEPDFSEELNEVDDNDNSELNTEPTGNVFKDLLSDYLKENVK